MLWRTQHRGARAQRLRVGLATETEADKAVLQAAYKQASVRAAIRTMMAPTRHFDMSKNLRRHWRSVVHTRSAGVPSLAATALRSLPGLSRRC